MIVASGRIKVVPFFFSSSIFSETISYVTKALLGPQVSLPGTLSQTQSTLVSITNTFLIIFYH